MSWPPANRACAQCAEVLPRDEYSKNQYSKGLGLSRCSSCVHGIGSGGGPSGSQTARRNNATEASIDNLDHPFAQGAFRWVQKGRYTAGQRVGQACVCKWFKSGCTFEEIFYSDDIKASEKATHIVEQWNQQHFINKKIQLNQPEVWTFKQGSRYAGQKHLIEPFIENWQKFNSNSGWVSYEITAWNDVMQALSHYSYHVSSGQFVLCDLQGGVYRHSAVLSDPVIMSRRRGSYGVTDLGPEGISNFFYHHQCNEHCRSGWSQPRETHGH